MKTIKCTGISTQKYWSAIRELYKNRLKELNDNIKALSEKIKYEKLELDKFKDWFKTNCDISLDSYTEYKNNMYESGKFLRTIKGLQYKYLKTETKPECIGNVITLYELASNQESLYKSKLEIEKINIILSYNFSNFLEILKIFYNEVSKYLVLNAYGYVFESDLGWVCFNRVKCPHNKKPKINFQETMKNRKQYIAEGKKVYDKTELDWCTRHGIKYEYNNDYVVYREPRTSLYEFVLLRSRYKATIDAYVAGGIYHKTINEVRDMINSDINKLFSVDYTTNISLYTKLNLLLEIDPTLYLNFVRNENQESVRYRKASRKD